MQKLCDSCGCVKTEASFSKTQWRKQKAKCRQCIERDPELPIRNSKVVDVLGARTVSFLKKQQAEGVLPKREVEALPAPANIDSFWCTFCGLDNLKSHQVKQFGPNIVCTLCEERCRECNIPLDLSREEAMQVQIAKRQEIYRDLVKDATEIGDFQVARLMTPIADRAIAEEWRQEVNSRDRAWFNAN